VAGYLATEVPALKLRMRRGRTRVITYRMISKHSDETHRGRGIGSNPTALSAGIALVEKDGKKQFIKTKRLFFFE